MKQITNAQLKRKLSIIGELTGMAVSKIEAMETGKTFYLHLDYNPTYGGYRLEIVKLPGYTTAGIFGGTDIDARLTASCMDCRLQGIIDGIKYEQQQK